MICIPEHILRMKEVYAPGKMVLAVIEANPDIGFRGIAQILHISPFTAKEIVGSLRQRGYVTVSGKGKTFTYQINDKRAI